MQFANLHSWDLTAKEAVVLQRELAGRVDKATPLGRCELIAGADVSFDRFSDVFYATVVVVKAADGTVVETQETIREVHFPYVPGILSFREAPVLLETFAKVQSEPDVVMIDAHGLAHPRRFGLASHVGLILERPTIGVAKSLLVGTYADPGREVGDRTPLLDGDETIGAVVRTRKRVKPMFVSVGHRVDLDSAVRVALASCRGYRVPEPTRLAHIHVNEMRRAGGAALT